MANTEIETVIWLVLGFSFLFISLIIIVAKIILIFKHRQQEYSESIINLKDVHEKEILRSQLEIQEQTFNNISKEIHDNIGQKLSLAKLYLNTIESTEIKRTGTRIPDSVQIIGEVIQELSNLSRSMNPDLIANLGLVRAVEAEINNLSKTGFYQIRLVITGESYFFEPEKELILFRIVQEALNNIVKHAQASAITLDFYFHANSLEMLISDNGVGFAKEQTAAAGAGLLNMKKRAQVLNGQFQIESDGAKGTTIKLTIPV